MNYWSWWRTRNLDEAFEYVPKKILHMQGFAVWNLHKYEAYYHWFHTTGVAAVNSSHLKVLIKCQRLHVGAVTEGEKWQTCVFCVHIPSRLGHSLSAHSSNQTPPVLWQVHNTDTLWVSKEHAPKHLSVHTALSPPTHPTLSHPTYVY